MQTEATRSDIVTPVVGGKAQPDRESNETKEWQNSLQTSEDIDTAETKFAPVKENKFPFSDVIIPETFRGGKPDLSAGKDSLDKSTCYTGSRNTRNNSSLKSSLDEKVTLEVFDIQVVLPERDSWIDKEKIDPLHKFVGALPFNLSPDNSKLPEKSLVERKMIRHFQELLVPKPQQVCQSTPERLSFRPATTVKRELLKMSEDSCISLRVVAA